MMEEANIEVVDQQGVEQTQQGESKPEGTQTKAGSIENGAYEVIKSRLMKHGQDLKQRLEQLNDARKNTFGAIEASLKGNERVITDNNCIPRDMAPVGNAFLFGYNVQMGLKSKVELEDVFAIYEYKSDAFQKQPLQMICNSQFQNDFAELYQYYKNTFFAKFTIKEPYLYMIFQTAKNAMDIKAFKWLIKEGQLTYMDNRSDHEVRFTSDQGFDWTRVRREDHREGIHSHISILDKVFVETIGGDLTIKVEDNTKTGKGIYSEGVEDKDQTLDDAEIFYTALGHLILLKVRPYKEKAFRYFVYNEKLQNIVRMDAIKDACRLLPDNHGLIFPKGFYLQGGEYKLFDVPGEDFIFEQKIEAPNGEDFQYFFYHIETGSYLVYSYNLIEQTVETPIICSGYSHFKNGEMLVFKHEQEPRKNHMIQIWQTPYVGKDYVTPINNDSLLFKIGNKEIVRAMADCKAVYHLIQKGERYASIYVDIVKEAEHIIDSYFWIEKQEAYQLKTALLQIKEASAAAVAEYEKVTNIKQSTQKQINAVDEKAQSLLKNIEFGNYANIDEYVKVLADLRVLRGEIISLKDLRYTHLSLIEALDKKAKEKSEQFSKRCVEFLLEPQGLQIYIEQVKKHQERITGVGKTSEGKLLLEDMAKTSSDLELLIEIVSNFKIEDATKTTEIIENISSIFSQINSAKAKLKSRMEELAKVEGSAQFTSQMKLLNQAVVNYLDMADSQQKCEEYLNKVMVQIQDLEGKFADFDAYIVALTEKREELYAAFETKKQVLLDQQNKKLQTLFSAADRILKGMVHRVKGFDTLQEINGYFATDVMAEKVRDTVEALRKLGDTVKADEIEARFKTIKENALRQLKDKQELFVDGKNIIKLGKHKFSVNTQALDLAIVQKEHKLYYHISGTDFWDEIKEKAFEPLVSVWDQEVLSENKEVYRGEYLAYKIFEASLQGELEAIAVLNEYSDIQLLTLVQKFMESRYLEGYTKGIHDVDGHKILKALLILHQSIDLLVYSQQARAMAQLFWQHFADAKLKLRLNLRLKELSKITVFFDTRPQFHDDIPSLVKAMETAFCEYGFLKTSHCTEAAEYLCREIMRGNTFIISQEAEELILSFWAYLKEKKALECLNQSLKAMAQDMEGAYYLVREWVSAFMKEQSLEKGHEVLEEVINLLMLQSYEAQKVIRVQMQQAIKGLSGNHPIIKEGTYTFSYTRFMEKLKSYERTVVPSFMEYHRLKKTLSQQYRESLHLDEFKPTVLTSFVRNKLIDQVYLPLIGDNLAKQIGAVGQNKRTDLMGMLLLISPPGYGKTTLMEYIASCLGITLIKINGPAIGHEVTSLDPENARHASGKEELRKLNLALKMGNNVMLYLDDIQHCNPELLQKFISLCDGQRKIEGVYHGVSQTYDLKGKKVAVVMAGNPYTESGSKFQIPDMLANRADVYNLGDMLRENENAFMLSYIENSLTSNPVLNQLAAKSQKDVAHLIAIATDGVLEGVEFEGNYSEEEMNEFVAVIKKLLRVRDIVLKINMEYIRSAASSEEYRNEPPFKLQGSYRNMNKIAERIQAVMNEQELSELILSVYENDAQTLSTGAEANMLKWKEIVGVINEQEKARWQEIKSLYLKSKLVKGDDKMGQAVLKLNDLCEALDKIKEVLSEGVIAQK